MGIQCDGGELPVGLKFYERDAVTVARELLGHELVHRGNDGALRIGRIVETEAYCGPDDRACHAHRGLTNRTRTLLGPAGHAYVFVVYGRNECFNVVCGAQNERGHAVLIRGVEPVRGIPEGLRGDGPGRLSRALALSRALDGASLLSPSLHLRPGAAPKSIAVTPRVGVGYAGDHAALPWRFFDAESRSVSRPSRRAIGLGIGPLDV